MSNSCSSSRSTFPCQRYTEWMRGMMLTQAARRFCTRSVASGCASNDAPTVVSTMTGVNAKQCNDKCSGGLSARRPAKSRPLQLNPRSTLRIEEVHAGRIEGQVDRPADLRHLLRRNARHDLVSAGAGVDEHLVADRFDEIERERRRCSVA